MTSAVIKLAGSEKNQLIYFQHKAIGCCAFWDPAMKVTIHDVAAKAGVSIKTVSRVMNNEPSVKQATIDKVNQAMQELHYQPNAAARNLASTKSYSIGYIYDNPNAYYVIDMQRGLLDACRKHGYELLIHPTNAKSKDIVQEVIELVQHARLAGLVLTPPFSEMPEIAEARVVPIPHPEFGLRPVAFVRAWQQVPAPESLREQLRAFLPGYKIPDHFLPWPEDLATQGLKINRQALIQRAENRLC